MTGPIRKPTDWRQGDLWHHAAGLDNFVSLATFESLGNNLVRGNGGGDAAGTITVIGPR